MHYSPHYFKTSFKAFISLAFTAGLTLLLLSACGETPEDRQIAAGLSCLDSAKGSDDADVCLQKVEGLDSQKSYLIRCSANFIAQGFTGRRVAEAFQKLKDNQTGGNSQTAAMMAYFVFAKNLPSHTATVAYANCNRSGVQSMIGLATFVQTATLIAGTGISGTNLDPNDPSFDPNQLQTNIQNLAASNDPAVKEQIGQLAQNAQAVYCGTGSGYKSQDVCTKLDAAIAAGGGNAQTIGQQLLNLL